MKVALIFTRIKLNETITKFLSINWTTYLAANIKDERINFLKGGIQLEKNILSSDNFCLQSFRFVSRKWKHNLIYPSYMESQPLVAWGEKLFSYYILSSLFLSSFLLFHSWIPLNDLIFYIWNLEALPALRYLRSGLCDTF